MRRRRLLQHGAGAIALAAAPASRAAYRSPAAGVSVGVTPGPQADVMAVVRDVAAASGLALRLEIRPDGAGINVEVARGRLDAASFQDQVAFAAEMRHGGALVGVASTITRPMAIYSRHLASLRDLKARSVITVPTDRMATSRALILLQNYGVIELRRDAGLNATLRDIVGNRLGLTLLRRPPGGLGSALDRFDAVVLDSEQAARIGLLPGRDSIGIEDARTPYADILAVRREDRAQSWVERLVGAYRSEPVKRFILERFQGSVRRPW